MKLSFIIVINTFLLVSCSKQAGSPLYSVKVIRGSTNQPSIKVELSGDLSKATAAEADSRLFEEQGYQVALDNFLSMDVFRRSSLGKTAEVFGAKAFEQDLGMIGRGLVLTVENSVTQLKKFYPETYVFLEAYTKGVNRFISSMAQLRPEWLKFYRQITKDEQYVPGLWTASDSVAIAAFLKHYLNNSLNEKFGMGAAFYLLELLGQAENFSSLIDLRPLRDSFIFDKPFPGYEVTEVTKKVSRTALSTFFPMVSGECRETGIGLPACAKPAGTGSNNWAISSRFSRTGETYLANDPHLILTQQGIMKQIALDSKSAGGTIRTRGMTPPGAPGVLIGHNDEIAWGITNFPADVDDVYLEVLSSQEQLVRNAEGKWEFLEEKNIVRKIRTENGSTKEITIPLKIVPGHGPLISNYQKEIKVATLFLESQGGKVGLRQSEKMGASYRWTGHEGGAELAAIVAINRAKDFAEFKKGLEGFEGAQNFIYGDKKGNIGYYSHARFPIRKYLSAGRPPYIPVQAFQKEDFGSGEQIPREWDGYRTDFPEIYNPEKGYLITANNDLFGTSKDKTQFDYSNYLGYGFDFGYRAFRINELIQQIRDSKGFINFADMKTIQNDVKDYAFLDFMSYVDKLGLVDSLSGDKLAVVSKLLEWDGVSDRGRNEPLIYYYWLMELVKERFEYESVETVSTRTKLELSDFLSEKKGEKKNTRDIVRKAWNESLNSLFMTPILVQSLFNFVKTEFAAGEKKHNRLRNMFRVSLNRALAVLDKNSVRQMNWGQLNRLNFLNPLQGLVPSQFNISVERSGSFSTISPSLPSLYLGDYLPKNFPGSSGLITSGGDESVKGELKRLNLYREGNVEEDSNNGRPGFGAAFRIVFKLKEGEPIEGQISMPSGNWNVSESPNAVAEEIYRWRDGKHYHELVPFID